MMFVLPREPVTAGDGVAGKGAGCCGRDGAAASDPGVGPPEWLTTGGGAGGSMLAVERDGASAGRTVRTISELCFAGSIGALLGAGSTGTLGVPGCESGGA